MIKADEHSFYFVVVNVNFNLDERNVDAKCKKQIC